MKQITIFLIAILSHQSFASIDLKCATTAQEAKAILATVEECYVCKLNLALWEGFPRVVIYGPPGVIAYTNGNYVDPIYVEGSRHIEAFLPPDRTYVEFWSKAFMEGGTLLAEKIISLKPNAVCSLTMM